MATQLFRKVSLERLSSPEQLDTLMQITTPKGWVALLAIGGLLMCAVIWGIWGSISDKVMGQGILIKSGGVFNIVSNSTGRVQNLYVDVNDVVYRGQIVARLEQPEILDRIRNARASLNELIEKCDQIAKFGTKEMKLERESMAQQRSTLEQSIITLKEQVQWLEKKLENQKVVMEKGLITKQQFINTQENLSDAKQKIRETRNQLQQVSIREVQLKNQQNKELLAMNQKIEESRRELKRLQDELNQASKVESPYTGRILEVSVDEGTVVNRGTTLMNIELMGKEIKNLEAVLYFPPREGKKIRLGMQVQVAPSTVKQEKYGFVKGMVTHVSEFPSTFQGMMRTLQNQELVSKLSMGGAPIEVRADLIPDPGTPSGYKWSSSKGPPMAINTGTLCFSTVTTAEQPPISLVIPLFKKHVLGIGEE
jgi:HlyD family secretion protein